MYATIKNVIVTLKQTVRVLPGDAVVSCDARHVVVVSHRDRLRHVFPIEANVEDVYTPNVVFGVFPWVGPDPELKRRIRDGSAVLLRVY